MPDNSTTCITCGAEGDGIKITDKLKFRNKRGGTMYIHYKQGDKKGALCRKCWQKNLKHFHDKIEKSNQPNTDKQK